MIIKYIEIFCFISLISNIFSDIDIKNLNENSLLKFPLKSNLYLSSSLFIKDQEYTIPIDISLDRSWFNTKDSSNNHNKQLVIEECPIYELNFKTKKNSYISFFDKSLVLEDIYYEEISNNLNNLTCDTKNGIIGLSPKSEKKILNLLTQLNKSYLLKKYFSIYKNELIIGNFEEEIKQNKHIKTNILDSFQNKWVINLQGVYFGEIDSSYISNNQNEFKINVLNNNYKSININCEFNTLQRMIIVEYYLMDSIHSNIFRNKCNLRRNEDEKFDGIYCDKDVYDKLPDLSFMINNKLLHVPKNKLFIKDKNNPNEFLFLIAFSDIIWEKGTCLVGSYFFNELAIKTIFDAENNNVYLLSNDIIENIKIVDDYSVDDKQIILNNNSFSIYDFTLCFILISNFFGIIILLISLYKEKIFGKTQNHIRKMKRMNKQ